jgi:uroporphyrinogen decarboxylase
MENTAHKPDVQRLMDVLTGKIKTKEVQLMELSIDPDIMQKYTEQYLKRSWVNYDRSDREKRARYWDNVILCHQTWGYSGFRVSNGLMFPFSTKETGENSVASNRNRKWVDHNGAIRDEKSFEDYPWPSLDDVDLFDYEYVSEHLPEGMGIFACVFGGIFEMVCEYLVGFEELCFMSLEQPELMEKIIKKTGDLLLDVYRMVVKIPKVACVFQGDDFGYTHGLIFPPEFYQQYILPWHRQLADIAHQAGIPYVLHSCGNLRSLGSSLFEFGMDAKHSFEDKGWSVIDFYREHSDKVGVIGGLDVDKLCRLSKSELEAACKEILDACHVHGRYVFGSGNSIPNYIPFENFLTMLDVAKQYRLND